MKDEGYKRASNVGKAPALPTSHVPAGFGGAANGLPSTATG